MAATELPGTRDTPLDDDAEEQFISEDDVLVEVEDDEDHPMDDEDGEDDAEGDAMEDGDEILAVELMDLTEGPEVAEWGRNISQNPSTFHWYNRNSSWNLKGKN